MKKYKERKVKRLLWILPLLALMVLVSSCGGNPTPSSPQSTQSQEGSVAEVTQRASNVTLPPTTPTSAGNPAPQVTSVSVVAQKNTVAVGEQFEVVVVVDILDNISRGAECGFSWTPGSLVKCTDVADGDFYKGFTTVHMGASGARAVHNDTGTVESLGQFCTSEPMDSGAKGEGVLFIYYFTALQKGEVTFSVPRDSLLVGDVNGDPISVQSYNSATVTVQ
jgi:hypothetical protein